MVVYTYNLNPGEVENRGSGVQGHPQLHTFRLLSQKNLLKVMCCVKVTLGYIFLRGKKKYNNTCSAGNGNKTAIFFLTYR